MANPLKGEAELVAGDTTYTLVLNFNALVEAEAASGLLLPELMLQLQGQGGVALRAVLWSALQERHPCSLVEASEIIAGAGLPASWKALNDAVTAAFPPAEVAKPANPRKAATGTGKAG